MYEAQVGSADVLGKAALQGCKDCFADRASLLQNDDIPKAQHGVAVGTHELIAPAVMCTFDMLTAVDLDDEPSFPASEVSEEGADGELARKFETAQPAQLQLQPEQGFRFIIGLAELTSAFGDARFPAASRGGGVFPHSVPAGHLSPRWGERKGA